MTQYDINNLDNGDRGCGMEIAKHLDVTDMLTDRYQPLSKMRKRVVYY